MATKEEMKRAIATVSEAVAAGLAEVKLASGFLGTIKALFSAVPSAVKRVEVVGKTIGIKGADKQDLAITAILSVVKLPWWFKESWARVLLALAIDIIVDAMKGGFKK